MPDDVIELRLARLATPLGEALLVVDGEERLRALDWHDHEARMHRLLARHYGPGGFRLRAGRAGGEAAARLAAYFEGATAAIEELPVATGGTAFQNEVWRALRAIPRGSAISYAELARRIGRPKAVRAVGLANGANPVGIVVPCHRVIGSDGSLTGYGGGLERKRWLLAHEGWRSPRA